MYLHIKIFFIILILLSYFSCFLTNNTNLKALNKIFLFSLSLLILLAIIFQETVIANISEIFGVAKGTESILYLFMYISLSVNFILAKKIIVLEENLKKVVQKIAFLK